MFFPSKGVIAIILVVAFLLKSIITRYVVYRRLSHIPGPATSGWSNLWLARQVYKQRTPYAEMEGFLKYGSPLRIAPKIIATDDPDLWRYITSARSSWRRGPWYDGVRFGADVHTVFSERNEKLHAEKRAMEIGAYQMKDVLTVEDDVDEILLKLIDLLKQKYQTRYFDLAAMSSWFTIDVLSKIAFGEALGFLDADEDLWQYHALQESLFSPLEMILSIDWLRNFICWRPIERLIAPKPSDKVGVGRIMQFARERIQARYARDPKGTERQDFMGHFIRKGLTQIQTDAESRLQIIAGSDSTSSAIRNTLNLIISNTRVFTKLRAEVEDAVANGQISFPIVKNSEAQKLEYLQACLWEGLRLFPPLFGLLSKGPGPGGDTYKGIHYPEDCEITVCLQALCRRRDIYGEDVDVFRPERWLDPDPKVRQRLHQNTELIFGYGKYSCLGKMISFMEQNKFVVEMIRRFDWAVADPYKGSTLIAAGLWVQRDMNYYVHARQE